MLIWLTQTDRVCFWIAMLSLSRFQVGQENVIFYNRFLLLGYVASEYCSENLTPCRSHPSNRAFPLELGCAAGDGEGERMMWDKTHLSDSHTKREAGFAHPLSQVSPSSARLCVMQGAERAPPRRGMQPSTANTLRCFAPAPTVLWGKFLQDASCYSLNHLSSFSSIKLGIAKASSDLAIKSCFCRAAHYLQQAFSSLVNAWIFWLRILSTAVSGNGSCPACASPQKRWLSSSRVLTTQICKRLISVKVPFEAYR